MQHSPVCMASVCCGEVQLHTQGHERIVEQFASSSSLAQICTRAQWLVDCLAPDSPCCSPVDHNADKVAGHMIR